MRQGSSNPFYDSPDWIALRDKFRRDWLRTNKPCGYCGEPIVPGSSVAVDHIKPVRTHPHLALDPNNLRVVHARCNTKARHTEKKVAIGLDGYPEGW